MSANLPSQSVPSQPLPKTAAQPTQTLLSSSPRPHFVQPANMVQHPTGSAEISTTSHSQPFQPYFALISDATSSTTHHPVQVHYLFSDDDPELLTTACIKSTASHSGNTSPQEAVSSQSRSTSDASNTEFKYQRSRRDRENRVLILDVDETGTNVLKAQSLSSSWQILATSLTPAPTWDGAQVGDGNMMLRIEGTDGLLPVDRRFENKDRDVERKEHGSVISNDQMQALMQEFDERMQTLRTIVGTNVEQDEAKPDLQHDPDLEEH